MEIYVISPSLYDVVKLCVLFEPYREALLHYLGLYFPPKINQKMSVIGVRDYKHQVAL